jgi:hypothetical protein
MFLRKFLSLKTHTTWLSLLIILLSVAVAVADVRSSITTEQAVAVVAVLEPLQGLRYRLVRQLRSLSAQVVQVV